MVARRQRRVDKETGSPAAPGTPGGKSHHGGGGGGIGGMFSRLCGSGGTVSSGYYGDDNSEDSSGYSSGEDAGRGLDQTMRESLREDEAQMKRMYRIRKLEGGWKWGGGLWWVCGRLGGGGYEREEMWGLWCNVSCAKSKGGFGRGRGVKKRKRKDFCGSGGS